MEIQSRKHHTDQENIYAGKGKSNQVLPGKRQGLGVRGALGDVNTNLPAPQQVNVGKVAVAAAEFEKKATLNRVTSKINYGHVSSKVDTGRTSSRPVLRREESTTSLSRAARVALKESQNKTVEDATTSLQGKKVTQEAKRTTKIAIKNKGKENKEVLKTKKEDVKKDVIKDPVESLEKLQLTDQKYMDDVYFSPVTQLPDGIEDIDAKDQKSPLLLSEYIKDIYKYQAQLELQFAIDKDFLRNQIEITGKMRATLIDWLVDVQSQFQLTLETMQLTVGIIDRYLQVVPTVRRDRLQLIGVTALFIATKYEEVYVPDVGDFVYVTANAYTKQDLFTCERDMLCKLGFCLARPIPLSFLRRFVKIAGGKAEHHHLAKYLVDLCLVESSMAHYRPSELAAAAICLSLHVLSEKELEKIWTPTLRYYSQYSLEHIQPIIRKIARLVVNVGSSKTQAVYKKYSHESLAKSSIQPQLKGEAILKLAKLPADC